MTEDLEATPAGAAIGPSSGLGEGAGAAAAPREARGGIALGLVRAARPKQWIKNVLVLAAPGAAGVLVDAARWIDVAQAFVALCLVASGTYLLNDVADVEADRAHPLKRHRPVASGEVPAALAVGAGILALLAGLATAYAAGLLVLVAVGTYVVLTLAYTVWLKHVAVLDVATVASLFVVRAVAGGVAAGVAISRWFLIVASFGSLFVVAGKRYSESREMGDARGETRATLAAYSPEFLRHVWTVASGVAITAYCLWAFEQAALEGFPLFELSIVPFLLFMLRYALIVDAGQAGAPEDVLLRDRALQVIGLAWVVVFVLGVYLGA